MPVGRRPLQLRYSNWTKAQLVPQGAPKGQGVTTNPSSPTGFTARSRRRGTSGSPSASSTPSSWRKQYSEVGMIDYSQQGGLRPGAPASNNEFKQLSVFYGHAKDFYRCSGVFDARCSMPPTSWEKLKMDFLIWQNIHDNISLAFC